jgi:hypothetical protein
MKYDELHEDTVEGPLKNGSSFFESRTNNRAANRKSWVKAQYELWIEFPQRPEFHQFWEVDGERTKWTRRNSYQQQDHRMERWGCRYCIAVLQGFCLLCIISDNLSSKSDKN